YNGKKVTADISTSVLAYVSVIFAFVMLITIVLAFLGLDFADSITAAITSLSNVGPALGPNIGPLGNFQPLPWESKLVLTFGMLLGRLEFFTILVLFSPEFWR
ncbi:MAG TPA: potassium transporter TrkH, partial [Rhizobiales bacterium]|nr:potassium transporter TrkH [Hyphomicrobiales bacterium]